MNTDEKLSGALQENILTLLCFDDKNCRVVRAALTPRLFESAVYREVAGLAIDFIDQYGETIKEHLPDHLELVLKGDDARKSATYEKLLKNLFEARESVNGDYVISSLHKFVRQQTLKAALLRAVEAIEGGNIDVAEVELQKGLLSQSVAFEGGLNLSSASDVLSILDMPEEEGFDLGIPALDSQGIIPRRKELFTFMAARGRGKSWFITHCLKHALLQRWSAVVITLEMSEKRYASRMLQSFFSISRGSAQVKLTKLVKARDGSLQEVMHEVVERMTMQDADLKQKLTAKAKREFRRRPPIRIKEFPTRSLDVAGLKAYLEGLERFEKFTPDLICIDYPDLMRLDSKNLRLELSELVADLRGIGVARNAAMVIVTQGNRESEKATLVTGDMAAEDISKIATSDVVLTYSQTPTEKQLNLARLYVEKARNSESKQTVLITQAYTIGQFCLDSMPLRADANYFGTVTRGTSERQGEEERDTKSRRPVSSRARRAADASE